MEAVSGEFSFVLLYKNVSSMLELIWSMALDRDCSQVGIDKVDKSRKAPILRWEELDLSSASIEDNGTMARMYPT